MQGLRRKESEERSGGGRRGGEGEAELGLHAAGPGADGHAVLGVIAHARSI